MTLLETLASLVAIPAPPGQEGDVVNWLKDRISRPSRIDAKGNLLVSLSSGEPRVVVTAHCDEIALMVRQVEADGGLRVVPMGGIHPWKLGEGPVLALGAREAVTGVLSFGSIHTEDPRAVVRQCDSSALNWSDARVFTGQTPEKLAAAGVRVGTRVVVHPSRRAVVTLGDYCGSYFLDDRADLVAWLLALESLRDAELPVLFAATVSEEVGGEGAQYLLHELRAEAVVALELGPNVPDAPVRLDAAPTVWAKDTYAAMAASDLDLITALEPDVQLQALSRGGSDASIAASTGLCARPFTLGIPMENGHGFEIMHRGAMQALADLTVKLVRELCETRPGSR
ncbi:MAG: M20/M25/M40 family metallo-hydrolase [Fimbriimonadaceae bacterium]|nr:M20/M25/M40 family metallo-hydrolase [Fimbriimonadaceae bacterium]